jgi:rubrerythrin
MGKLFYFSEIVKFAIEKEKESYALYEKLANKVSDVKLKDFFRVLMQQEKHHQEFYAEMLKHVAEQQSPNVKEDEEYNAYMQELIAESRKVFALDVDKLLASDLVSILDYAAAREKDSILFYVGLKNYLPAKECGKIDDIISEEGRHLTLLMRIKKEMK